MSPATQEIYDVLISDPKLQIDNSPNVVENSEVEDSDDSLLDPNFNVKNLTNVSTISETDCESSDDIIESKSTSTQSYQNLDENKIDCVISTTETQNVHEIHKERDKKHTQHETAAPFTAIENTTGINEKVISNIEIVSTSEKSANNSRKKCRSRMERSSSKILRNAGKSYITEKGKVVSERQTKELGSCRLKCAERITMAEQTQTFDNYWKLGDRDRRAAFVSKSVKIFPKKTQITGGRTSNRDCYCKYELEICNVAKPVCKECFCKILGETKGFVNVVIEKKRHLLLESLMKTREVVNHLRIKRLTKICRWLTITF